MHAKSLTFATFMITNIKWLNGQHQWPMRNISQVSSEQDVVTWLYHTYAAEQDEVSSKNRNSKPGG